MTKDQVTEMIGLIKDAAERSTEAAEHAQKAVYLTTALSGNVDVLKTEVKNMAKELDILAKVVRGNGKPDGSLIVRMQAIEYEVAARKRYCEEKHGQIEKIDAIDRQGKWSVRVAVVGGLTGLISFIGPKVWAFITGLFIR